MGFKIGDIIEKNKTIWRIHNIEKPAKSHYTCYTLEMIMNSKGDIIKKPKLSKVYYQYFKLVDVTYINENKARDILKWDNLMKILNNDNSKPEINNEVKELKIFEELGPPIIKELK